MDSMVSIRGFHTCKADGGKEFIKRKAPFLSELNKRQWLTQGYYFWTDIDLYAHEWGRKSIDGNYVIIRCDIELKKHEFLDLVGSGFDQQYFQKLIAKFHDQLKKNNPLAPSPSVNGVISYYRDKAKLDFNLFPYYAIKTEDQCKKRSINFIDNGEEVLFLVKRQQLCLFEFAKKCIKSSEIVYPEEFK
jgi:hypothetical protein